MRSNKEILFELKEKSEKIRNSKSKYEILKEIESLKNYPMSVFFRNELLSLNLELFDKMKLDDFKFHSLLTVSQTMVEITGLSVLEIHRMIISKK